MGVKRSAFTATTLALGISAVLAFAPMVMAADTQKISKLKSLTVMYGRAIGCGLPGLQAIGHQIGHWMDRKFPAGSKEQIAYLPVFTNGVKESAAEQYTGKSPVSCESIASYFASPRFSALIAD
jgi:hypothetical protein